MASVEQEERLKKWKNEAGDLIQSVITKTKRKRRFPVPLDRKHKSKAGIYQDKLVKAAEEGVQNFGSWWLSEPGYVEAEDNESTFKFNQQEILKNVPIGAAQKTFDFKLPQLGPYKINYSQNGRHLLLGGRKGHLAEFDWATGKLLTEIQVRETVRDVQFLHNHLYWAAAQKKYVFIYDHDGMELHRLKSLHEPHCLEFLPHHFLLCSTGNTGFVSWLDTSSGKLIASHSTNKGCCRVMSQNPWNAVISLGHSFGAVSMWTPNMDSSVALIKAHNSPISALAFDPTGQYMISAAVDRMIKVWDVRKFEPMHCYFTSKTPEGLAMSQTGLMAIGYGTRVEIWKDAIIEKQMKPYLTHRCPSGTIHCLKFCPYEDLLGIGHDGGISQILTPGSGEPNFDSYIAHPFQNKKARRESEVAHLLDKLPPEMISLNPNDIIKVKTTEKDNTNQEEKPVPKQRKSKGQMDRKMPEDVPYSLRKFYPGKKPTRAKQQETAKHVD